ADDVLLPERLSHCVNEFVLHPECDVVYSDYVLFHQGEGFIKLIPAQISDADTVKAMLFDLNVKFVVLMHTLMFRRSVVIETPFDTSFSHWSEDQDCWVRMALKNIRFFYVDEVLAVYRFAENNLTSKESELLLAKLAMVKKYSAKPELNKYSQEFLSSRLYLQQRLVMGYFMERSFSAGVRMMKSIVVQSSVSAIIKMICWGVIMLFFPKHVVVKTRAWIVTKTPLKWGAWKRTQVWPAPKYLVELLESEKQ
ncbi:MAG: glycosyltransferase family 2 protein, partial [Bacteriovoracaceae bacterium]